MRIVSKKKDYYDCIQAHGQNRDVVYVRTEIVEDLGQWPFHTPRFYNAFFRTNYTSVVIGFCGKIYPCFVFPHVSQASQHPDFCYTYEEVEKKIDAVKAKYDKQVRKSFLEYFKQRDDTTMIAEYFEKHRSPIFVAVGNTTNIDGTFRQENTIIYNALLRPWKFYRIFDPYSAFQEIFMYMSNQAVPQKPMPVIEDEMKLRSKGFTDQSFRSPFRDSRRIPK